MKKARKEASHMDREIFEKYKHRQVKIGLKPNNYVIFGQITEVFDDYIEFRSKEKVSYFEFDAISSLIPLDGRF